MGNQVEGIVVGRDGSNDAQRFSRVPPLAGLRTCEGIERDDFACIAFGLIGRELQRIDAPRCLFACLRNRFARLFDDQKRKLFPGGLDGCSSLLEDRRTPVTGQGSGNLRTASCLFQERAYVCRTSLHHCSDQRTVERAGDGNFFKDSRLGECKVLHHAASLAMGEVPAE